MLITARRPPPVPHRIEPLEAQPSAACLVETGLAGWIFAWRLARSGRRVLVAEEPGAREASGNDFAVTGIETDFLALERAVGIDGARLAAQSLAAAAECLQSIVRRERIACGLERLDLYRFAEPGAMGAALDAEARAAVRAGLEEAIVMARPPIEGAPALPCLRLPGHVMVHAGHLVLGLMRAVLRDGGRLLPAVAVREAHGGRRPWIACESGLRIEADLVALASRPALAQVHHRVAIPVRRGRVTRALYTERLPEGRFVAHLHEGSGSHETLVATSAAPPAAIEAWMRHRFPGLAEAVDRRPVRMPRVDDLIAYASQGTGDPTFFSAASRGTPLTRAVATGLLLHEFAAG